MTTPAQPGNAGATPLFPAVLSAVARFTPPLLRLALGAAFLSAVLDRLGFYGPPGAPNVAWGDFTEFTQYTARVNPWAPTALVPILASVATGAEALCGIALLLGFRTTEAALASGILLCLFAAGMTAGTGLKSALDASVLSAAAAAFSLALLGPGGWSLDRWWRRHHRLPESPPAP